MLDALGPSLTPHQRKDLHSRLSKKEANSVLAAEIELGLLWALAENTEIQTHFALPSTGKRPEAFCPNLFPSGAAFIEVTSISDDTFSDRDKMDLVADKFSHAANSLRTGAGKHLYFQFAENSGYAKGQFFRNRRVTKNFELTADIEEKFNNWITDPNWPNPRSIRLSNSEVDVAIQWRQSVHREGRTFCTMPSIAYDLEDNPVFAALKRKRAQLSGVPQGSLKCIFLGDAGCSMLRDLRPINPGLNTYSAEQVIWHFLNKSSVDIVVVFSAQRANIYRPLHTQLVWRSTLFDKRGTLPGEEYALLNAVATSLPRPNYESYQARSLQRQGSFHPQARGQYLGWKMTTRDTLMSTSIKLSARLVLEYLSGRITTEQFRIFGGNPDGLDSLLRTGFTFQGARIEPAGLDEDDDWLVFDLALDAAAKPLRLPSTDE